MKAYARYALYSHIWTVLRREFYEKFTWFNCGKILGLQKLKLKPFEIFWSLRWSLLSNVTCFSSLNNCFYSPNIFMFWFLVFWSLYLLDFLSVFFRLVHLALQNVNKDYVIFSYFHNFIAKSDKKPKTKNGMNETNMVICRLHKVFDLIVLSPS